MYHRLRDVDPDNFTAILESTFGNLGCGRGNGHLKEASSRAEIPFCSSIYCASRAINANFSLSILSMKQACLNQCLRCLSIIYFCLVIQQIYLEDLPVKGMFTRKLLNKPGLQALHRFCRLNGKDENITADGVHSQFAGHGCTWMAQNSEQGV